MSYSLVASSLVVSFTAITYPERFANRTMCREMPFGRAAIRSVGQSSRGRSQGRSSRAGSTVAAVMESEPLME
jgi:hypothetical protein